MKFEKQFRKDRPETIGETDSEFDKSNYINWLELKYEQTLRTMDNPDSEEGTRPERPDDDDKG